MIKYTNEYGSTIEFLENKKWLLTIKRTEVNTGTIKVNWSRIPQKHLKMWMDVAKSVFDKNKVDAVNSLIVSVSNFYEWLTYQSIEIEDMYKITEIDLGMLDEYLERERRMKKNSRRVAFTYLIKGFEELSLLKNDIDFRIINRLRDVRQARFKNINSQTYDENSEKVLSLRQLEKINEALVEEFQMCKTFNSDKLKYTEPDMFLIVAIWLGMKHGIRSTELLNLTTLDIKEDDINGHHQIFCKGSAAKPDRIVEINQQTLDIINFFIEWSKEARIELKTNALCVGMARRNDGKTEPQVIKNFELGSRAKKFIKRYDLYDSDDKPFDISMKNLRRTYGAIIAAQTENKEVLRQVMGHMDVQTTERHYTAQNKINLSFNVSKALKLFTLELAMTYRRPVVELQNEMPEVAKLLEQEPERDYKYGICEVPKVEDTLAASCKRAANCLECPHLIPESRKLNNYKIERDIWMKKAENANDDRVKQQRLKRVQMLDAYIYLIESALSKKKSEDSKNTKKGSCFKKSYKKRKR